MFANDEAAEAVLTADAFAGQTGRTHVNTASVSPAAADRLAAVAAASGVGYLSSPVLGRSTVAAAGQLNIMVAGNPAAIDAVEPFLADLGKRTWRFGDVPRMANVVKAAANYDIIHAIQALGESITLVEAHGVDGGEFVELLTNSLFGGLVYQVYGSIIAEQRYKPPGFTMSLGLKDLGLAETVAAEADVVLPSAPKLRELFEIALRDPELRDADWGGLAEVTRRRMALRP
jgi:3-hydroxyisobutyrate dehydrogenase-like beta-hydroxyacid dehydrogenase